MILMRGPKAPKDDLGAWVLYNLPRRRVAAGGCGSGCVPAGTREGSNDWKRTGYGGPCHTGRPPPLLLQAYALDTVPPDLGRVTKGRLEQR